MRKVLTALPLMLGIALAQPVLAKNGEAYIQPISSKYPLVELNVNIRDAKGKPIYGLAKEKFSLIEDLKEVEIVSFKSIEMSPSATNKVDIVFVFDDTGSMAQEIRGLKERTIEFADIIQSSGFDYNLGLISYKDKIFKPYRVTDNAGKFKSWVSDLRAKGGADEPENALDAIHSAAQQKFRDDAQKIFILITDATFHAADKITSLTMHEVVADLKSKSIQLHAVGPNIDQYKVMTSDLAGTFYDKDSGQFKRIITQIAGGSSSNYRITFNSSRPEYDFTWRAVELKVSDYSLENSVSQYQAPSWITASSRKDALKGGDSRYSPHFVVDGISKTSWVEGVSGSGIGEWLSLNFDEPAMVDRFEIEAGSSTKLPSKVAIKINDESKRYYSVNKARKLISGVFERELKVEKFQIIIEDASGRDIGIGDVKLFGGKPSKVIAPIKKSREARLSKKIALDLNKKGEKLYHAKKYDESIYYYKQAIDKSPTFAQAYSNLGLAYQRNGAYPNAIWANRKAIALARGKTKKVVSASSYYNIARIFEAQNKYEEALQNFHWAKSFKKHRAYDGGIKRMTKKLGL